MKLAVAGGIFDNAVHPRTGVGIETASTRPPAPCQNVHPRTGVGIETRFCRSFRTRARFTPARGWGLKLSPSSLPWPLPPFTPARGWGLKHLALIDDGLLVTRSPPHGGGD